MYFRDKNFACTISLLKNIYAHNKLYINAMQKYGSTCLLTKIIYLAYTQRGIKKF